MEAALLRDKRGIRQRNLAAIRPEAKTTQDYSDFSLSSTGKPLSFDEVGGLCRPEGTLPRFDVPIVVG